MLSAPIGLSLLLVSRIPPAQSGALFFFDLPYPGRRYTKNVRDFFLCQSFLPHGDHCAVAI
jgi:hypothetical protein